MSTIIVAVSQGVRRSTLSLALHGAGHTVEAVGDAEALVAAVKKRRPDILFLDPGLSLLATAEPIHRLRETGDLARVRLVLVDDPLAPVQAWACLARQLAGGALADLSTEAILRAVAAAGERLPPAAETPKPAPRRGLPRSPARPASSWWRTPPRCAP